MALWTNLLFLPDIDHGRSIVGDSSCFPTMLDYPTTSAGCNHGWWSQWCLLKNVLSNRLTHDFDQWCNIYCAPKRANWFLRLDSVLRFWPTGKTKPGCRWSLVLGCRDMFSMFSVASFYKGYENTKHFPLLVVHRFVIAFQIPKTHDLKRPT